MPHFKKSLLLGLPFLIALSGCGANNPSAASPSKEFGVYQESRDGNVELKILDAQGQVVVYRGRATEADTPPSRKVKLYGKCGPLIFAPLDAAPAGPPVLALTSGAENCENLDLPGKWARG